MDCRFPSKTILSSRMNGDPIYSPNKAKNPSLTTKYTKKKLEYVANKQTNPTAKTS